MLLFLFYGECYFIKLCLKFIKWCIWSQKCSSLRTNLKGMPYKQGYGNIIERLKYRMFTVHTSAERLLPTHPGKKSCCPLNLQKQKNRNYSLLFKNNDLSFLPTLFFPEESQFCVADSGREILNRADETGSNGSRF